MADQTIIAWTDRTFNPWMGCTKVSQGCKHCYAETLTKNRMGLSLWGPRGARQVTSLATWNKVRGWDAEARAAGESLRVFTGSLLDVFEDHPVANATRPRLWDWIREHDALDYQILTKRPENIAGMLPSDWGAGWCHVWLGTSIEDMRVAERADALRAVTAHVRFISYEPAIGPLETINLTGIHWLIYGGESGPGHRPEGTAEDPKAWARAIRARCAAEGTAFFHKQSAGWRTELGIELDGEIVREYPVPRRAVGARQGSLLCAV
jgi:protein gp37